MTGNKNKITSMIGHSDPLYHVHCVWYGDNHAEQDAAYIVHACNAYPKLVEALRYAANELDMLYAYAINTGIAEAGNPPHRTVRALLRELGEIK